MTQHTLQTKTIPLDQLTQHPHNPRNGDIELIAESLAVNGQYKPIVTSREGIILAGNHTYQAALDLGWDEIQVVELDVAGDSVEATRIMLADNRTSDIGRYDDYLLLETLEALDGELVGTGYDRYELERLERLVDRLNSADLNLEGEWSDMPEYQNGNETGAFRTTVHFPTEADAVSFFEMIGKKKRSVIWWPADPTEGEVRYDSTLREVVE